MVKVSNKKAIMNMGHATLYCCADIYHFRFLPLPKNLTDNIEEHCNDHVIVILMENPLVLEVTGEMFQSD